jgi:hypothetical protein
MVIVAHLGDSVNAYQQLFSARFPELDRTCPRCHEGRLWRHGQYERWVLSTGACRLLPIQRFRCPVCGVTVSLLPDFLSPYARYLLRVRAEAVGDRLLWGTGYHELASAHGQASTGLCPETVRSWVRRMTGLANLLLPWVVREVLHHAPGHSLGARTGPAPGVRSNLWSHFLLSVETLRTFLRPLLGRKRPPGSSTLGFLNAYLLGQGLRLWL